MMFPYLTFGLTRKELPHIAVQLTSAFSNLIL